MLLEENIINRKLFFFLLALLILSNWLYLFQSSVLPVTDFYFYYNSAEKISEFDFNLIAGPPLFPFVLLLVKQIFGIFTDNQTAYIYAARSISLFSVFLTALFSFKLMEKFSNTKTASLFSVVLSVQLFILLPSIFEISDMFFLALMIATVYFLYIGRKISLFFVLLLTLTRFEGILFFPAYLINFKAHRKYARLLLISNIVILFSVFIYFSRFGRRIFDHILEVFAQLELSTILALPSRISVLIFEGFCYPVSSLLPPAFKYFSATVLIILFLTGVYYFIRKKQISFMLSLIFVAFGLMIGKSIYALNFPAFIHKQYAFMWILYFFVFNGFLFVWEVISESEVLKKLVIIISLIFIFSFTISMFHRYSNSIFTIISLVLIFLILFLILKNGKKKGFLLSVLFSIFISSLLISGLKISKNTVSSDGHKGVKKISIWMKYNLNEDQKVLGILNRIALRFHTDDKYQIISFPFKNHDGSSNKKILKEICKFVVEKKIKYMVTERLTRKSDNPVMSRIQKYLFYHRENKYFKISKKLYYNKQLVGLIYKVKGVEVNE